MSRLHAVDVVEHDAQRPDRLFLVFRQRLLRIEVFQENGHRVADTPELAAVAADLVENVALDLRRAGAPEIDVDQADLAAEGAEPGRPGRDHLRHVAGEGPFEGGCEGRHALSPVIRFPDTG